MVILRIDQTKESLTEDESKTIVLSADTNKAQESTEEETKEIVEEVPTINK